MASAPPPIDQLNLATSAWNRLFRGYVDQVVQGLAQQGLAVTVYYDPQGEGFVLPDVAHLAHAAGEEILSKWHFDNWPVDVAVAELARRIRTAIALGAPAAPADQVVGPGPTTPGTGAPPAGPLQTSGLVLPTPAALGVPAGVLVRPYNIGSFPAGRGYGAARGAIADQPVRLNIAPIPGPPPVTIATAVLSVLGGLFRLFGGGVTRAVKQALEGLRAAIARTADELMRWTWRGMRAIGRILQAVGAVYVRVVRPVLDWLRDTVQRIIRIIDRILRPYYEWARRITQLVLDLYERYVRPVLIVIQRMRQVLAVLKILRIGAARRLDAQLARLQARIMQPIQELLWRINHLGGWLNVLVTARAVLQRVLYLRSLWQWQGSFFRAWWGWQSYDVSPAEADRYRRQMPVRSVAEVRSTFRDLVQTGGGDYALVASQARTRYRLEIGR
ncbi:MAG: hypothetical protein K6W08_07335 [Firmicutes bacterium]|nr:hypothetical protein [Bacillota bacterium]